MSQSTSAPAGATVIVAAGGTPNGIILHRAALFGIASGAVICAGFSSPTSFISNLTLFANAQAGLWNEMANEVEILPGNGLFYWGGAASGIYHVTYSIK